MKVKRLVRSLGLAIGGVSLSLTAFAGTPVVPVGFIDQAGQEQRQVPVTFGQVFVPGQVTDGSRLVIQIGDTELPTQVDVKATHPDGSVRHAILSTELPVVPAGSEVSAEIALADQAPAQGPALTAQALLDAGFDAEIRISLDGVTYTASARKALQAGGKTWLQGPIATEFVLKAPFTAPDGSTHPHLTGRFDLRAYEGLKSVRVDAIVENNWTYVPEPRNFTYDVTVSVGGQPVYEKTALTHYHHARWHKVFWWGAEPKVVVRHDTRYLQKTRAIPHYDPSIQASEKALDDVVSRRYEPMSNVWINPYMPEPGADRGIAPLPWWQALHVVSGGDPRAFQAVLDGGDAGGSYSAHLRDSNTDLPVSLDDYPRVTGDPYDYPKGGLIARCSTDCDTPLTHDTAHQPAIAFYPYLLTGDHYYLEELIFWANGNLMANLQRKREFEKGLFWNQQVRAQAWTLRTLAQAAYILPDDHPFKPYFLEKLANNAQFYREAYLEGGHYNAHLDQNIDLDNPLHVLVPGKLDELGRPWMDDFFTWAAAYAVDLGFTDWQPILEWKAEYPLARMGSNEDEYCWIFGATYFAKFGTGNGFASNAQWIPSFRELYLQNWGNQQDAAGNFVRDMACGGEQMAAYLSAKDGNHAYLPGEMVGYSDKPMGYPANLQPALAAIVDAGLPRADIAWDRLYNRVAFPDYSYDPQFAVTPRSLDPSYAVPVIEGFSASGASVDAGQTVTLTWSVRDADACEAGGDWSGTQAISGAFTTAALTEDAVFTLSCRNANGTAARSVLVTVNPPPTDGASDPAQDPVVDQPATGSDGSVADGSTLSGNTDGTTDLAGLDTGTGATDSEVVVVSVGATGPVGLGLMGLLGLWARRRGGQRSDTMNKYAFKTLTVAVASALAGAAQAAETGAYLHYDFEQANGDQILDAGANALTGTSRNTPVLELGRVGQALRFDPAAKDQITASIDGFPAREFTVSLWVQDARGDGRGSLFNYKSAGWKDRYFGFGGMDDLGVYLGRSFVKTGIRLGDGQWHHLAISWTRRNGHLRVYKDGVLAFETQDVNRARDLPGSGVLSLGAEPGKWSTEWGYAFGGLMDELRVFGRMLSDAEIAQMASQTPAADLAAPNAPAAIRAVAVSPTETYVSWDPASDDTGVAGYRLYRDGQLIATTGDTMFIDRGLAPGATVAYTVQAFDLEDKFSALSAAAQVAMPGGGSVLDVLPPGHWYEVMDSSIEADLGKTPNVMKPWSSGAYDSLRDRLVIFGGGHMDYSGNELYAFDVNALRWEQLTEPSAPEDVIKSEPIYADGRPSSVHTYDGLEYLPNVDRLFTSGGSIYGSGGCSGNTWLFDFDAQPAESGWQHIQDSKGGCGMISAFDAATGHAFYAAGGTLLEFDPLNLDNPWTEHPGVFNELFKFYMTAAIDPNRRKLAALGGTGYGGFPKTLVVDLSADPIPHAQVLDTTGATEIEDSDAAGFVFDPVSDRFVAWNGGASVYALDVDSKVWSRMDPAATNAIVPSKPQPNGTYGRFRYIPSKNAFILVNDVTENVFFYKLADGPGVALPYPQASLAASAATVEEGASVTLSWEAQDADACQASGDWSGAKALSGSEQVGPLTQDARFVLTCESAAGEAVREVLVQVTPAAAAGVQDPGTTDGGSAGTGSEPVVTEPQPVDEGATSEPVSDTVSGSDGTTAGGTLGSDAGGDLAGLDEGSVTTLDGNAKKVVVVNAASGPIGLLALFAGLLAWRRRRA